MGESRPSRFVVAIPLLLASGLAPVDRAEAVWQQTALPGGNAQCRALAVAPSQPSRVYIAPRGLGVYRTDDRGESWSSVSTGLRRDVSVASLAVAPADPSVVFAGVDGGTVAAASVYRSQDGGSNWAERSNGIDGAFIHALVVAASDPNVAFAALSSGNQPGVYRTLDGGHLWSFVSEGIDNTDVWDIVAHPTSPLVLLAGTRNGAARSSDGGTTWIPGANPIAFFRKIAWSASDPNRVYAIGDPPGPAQSLVYRSLDSGVSFAPAPAGWGDLDSVDGLAVNPSDPLVLLAAGLTETDCFFPYGSRRPTIWWSPDGADTWISGYLGECLTTRPVEVAFDPLDASHAYLAEDSYLERRLERGFMYSEAGGVPESWTTRVSGIPNYEIHFVRGNLEGVSYTRAADVLYHSDGSGWNRVSAGGVQFPIDYDPEDLEVNFDNPDLLFEHGTGTFKFPFRYLVRSTDGGIHWEPFFGGSPPGIPYSSDDIFDEVVSNHGNGDVVYARTTLGFYRSDDGGDSYTLASTVPDARFEDTARPVRTIVDPGDPSRVFLASSGDFVILSDDGGMSFEPRASGLPPPGAGLTADALFLRRDEPRHLLVVFSDGRIFTTEDAGLTWKLHAALDLQGALIADATWDPGSAHVFIVTSKPAIVTTHPTADLSGLPTSRITTIHYSPSEQTLFVGTEFHGLFQQTIIPSVGAPVVADAPLHAGDIYVSPNPFRAETSLRFVVPNSGAAVRLSVYDARGRRVRRVLDKWMPGGTQRVSWNGRGRDDHALPAGVYFLQLCVGGRRTTARAVLTR